MTAGTHKELQTTTEDKKPTQKQINKAAHQTYNTPLQRTMRNKVFPKEASDRLPSCQHPLTA